jgi:hypothetical protein
LGHRGLSRAAREQAGPGSVELYSMRLPGFLGSSGRSPRPVGACASKALARERGTLPQGCMLKAIDERSVLT